MAPKPIRATSRPAKRALPPGLLLLSGLLLLPESVLLSGTGRIVVIDVAPFAA
jgi:hypothetical protein